ncbi:MAG TPA: heme o synthase [Candidatus Saccharimonadales bacterium]|nr:heme o synthase [Candidatus Saccharimonadales bacterium]
MASVADYYHLAKPERTFTNWITAVAGFLLASQWIFDWSLFAGLLGGIGLVIASASVVNNYTDRGLDARMSRTKKRALVTDRIKPQAALIYALILGVIGFALLIIWVNWLVVLLGAIAYIDYVVLYGWSKRHTPWSTMIGTICGSLSLVAGYCAVTGHIDKVAWLLFLVMFCWQMVHFYAIAIYRRDDYKAAGLPVWSVVYGQDSTHRQVQGFILLYCVSVGLLAPYIDLVPTAILVLLSLYWLKTVFSGYSNTAAVIWGKRVFGVSLVVVLGLSLAIALGGIFPSFAAK